jgi:dCTP deaminase
MVVISKKTIQERINSGEISFDPPLDIFQLHNHAVDLRLGFQFAIPKAWQLTDKGREELNTDYHQDKDVEAFEKIDLKPGQFFDLLPHEYILATTLEKVSIPDDLMGILYPRSSTNRRGLSVDLTGIIDSGYEGYLTIPIRNNTQSQKVRLYPGERICQIVFEELSEAVSDGRQSRYHDKGPLQLWKKDKNDETELILSGDIEKMKKDFPLQR